MKRIIAQLAPFLIFLALLLCFPLIARMVGL